MQANPNQKAIDLIKSFEGFRAKSYLDLGGVPTCGYGTTKGIKLGMTTTPDQAEEWLRRDVTEVEDVIRPMIKVECSENELCALISFVYNVGVGNFAKSTLLKKLNAGDIAGATEEFLTWDHAGRHEVKGLLNRRKLEQAIFKEA